MNAGAAVCPTVSNKKYGENHMAIQVALYHKTDYKYDRKIQLGSQVVRLRPAPHCRTTILGYSQTIKPATHL